MRAELPIELQLLISFLVFLFTLALYCLFLAYINRGRHPFFVSGPWDTAGLLLALSGFLLYTLPRTILWPITVRVFDVLSGGEGPLLLGPQALVLAIGYYLALVGSAAGMMLSRRHKTVIYNVEIEIVRDRLGHVLAEMGLDFVEQSGRLLIAPVEAFTVPAADAGAFAATPMPSVAPAKRLNGMPGGPRYAELALEPFRPFCNVSLRWDVAPPYLRREIEQRLAGALENATPADNPAAGWFLGFAGLVFLTITMLAGMFVVLLIWRR